MFPVLSWSQCIGDTVCVLSPFEVVRRTRPTTLVLPGSGPEQPAAPYLCVEAQVSGSGRGEFTLSAGDVTLAGRFDGGFSLQVVADGSKITHRSQRHGRPEGDVDRV